MCQTQPRSLKMVSHLAVFHWLSPLVSDTAGPQPSRETYSKAVSCHVMLQQAALTRNACAANANGSPTAADANVNEARTDWRQLFFDALTPTLKTVPNASSLEAVATLVNAKVWSVLGALTAGGKPIVFRSEQTPLIFDPLSTLLFGYASCTGISITLVDALRTAGVPARLAGTPAWHGKHSDGNHNWVEVCMRDACAPVRT